MYNDGLLPRLRRDRFTLLLGACAVTGALLVLARGLNFGVALHTAGIHISVARSLLAGDGFMQIINGPMVNWPPLYPLLLAAATFFTFDPHAVAGPVNAIIFASTVLLVGLWLRQQLASRFLALWACLATMLAFPLVREASWASTEPLFILMSVLSLMHLDKFIREGRGPSLLWAAAFAALACLTRYIGIALAAASVLLLALQPGGEGGLRKARRIALYSLIALTPVCLWMTWNFVLVGNIVGKQFSVNYAISPAGFLHSVLDILATWLHPEWIAKQASLAGEASLLAIYLALALTTAYLIARPQPNWRGFTVFGAFALTYLAALAAAIISPIWVYVQSRYLTPVYVPLLLMATFAADNFLRRLPATDASGFKRTARFGLLAALCLWIGYSAALQAGQIRQALGDGPARSLSNSKWANSKTIQYIQDAPDGAMHSNAVFRLYIHSDPTKTYHALRPREDELRRLIETAEDGAYIVWFHDRRVGKNLHYNDFHLRSLPDVEVAADFFDGLVLRLRPNRRFDEAAYRANKVKLANQIVNAAGPVAIGARFNVHIDRNALTYIKSSCSEADTAEKFFLHIRPQSEDDLPRHRRRYGFDNLDFKFNRRGFEIAEKCVARIRLPEYPIAHITTGQFVLRKGVIWVGEIAFH